MSQGNGRSLFQAGLGWIVKRSGECMKAFWGLDWRADKSRVLVPSFGDGTLSGEAASQTQPKREGTMKRLWLLILMAAFVCGCNTKNPKGTFKPVPTQASPKADGGGVVIKAKADPDADEKPMPGPLLPGQKRPAYNSRNISDPTADD